MGKYAWWLYDYNIKSSIYGYVIKDYEAVILWDKGLSCHFIG
jgi:hypothetical protein